MKKIEIKQALSFGWDTYRQYFVFFLKLLAVVLVSSLVPAWLFGKLSRGGMFLGLLMQILNVLWQSMIGMGVLKISLKIYDQQPVDIPDLWSCLPQALDYILVKFLYSMIVSIGLLLLIIPGLIWSVQFYLASFLVVDKGMRAIPALRESSTVTYGAKWDIGIFMSVALGINLVGLFCFGVGLFVTLPVTFLAGVHIYRQLLAQTQTA